MKNVIIAALFLLFSTGIDAQCFPDRHNTSEEESWLSCQLKESPNPERGNSHWIMYDFGDSYELGQSHFWNLNVPEKTNAGISTAMIDYSLDGVNWTEFGSFNLAEANASGFYEGEEGPDLGGIVAQFVLITITENFGGECFGFSEMRIATTGVTVSVDELASIVENMSVQPNPALETTQLNFNASITGPASITLVDLNGKIVLEKFISITNGENRNTIDISPFAAGQYLINLNIDGKSKSTKLSIINK